jgi:hypothetical protein
MGIQFSRIESEISNDITMAEDWLHAISMDGICSNAGVRRQNMERALNMFLANDLEGCDIISIGPAYSSPRLVVYNRGGREITQLIRYDNDAEMWF